jgi:hypothetical protein
MIVLYYQSINNIKFKIRNTNIDRGHLNRQGIAALSICQHPLEIFVQTYSQISFSTSLIIK